MWYLWADIPELPMFCLPNTWFLLSTSSTTSTMAQQYVSTWWQHRYTQVHELIDTTPISIEPDPLSEVDEELFDLTDERIFHERNSAQVNIYLPRHQRFY